MLASAGRHPHPVPACRREDMVQDKLIEDHRNIHPSVVQSVRFSLWGCAARREDVTTVMALASTCKGLDIDFKKGFIC